MAAARTAPLLLLRAWPWLNPDGLEIRCVAPSLLDKVVASGEMNVADVVANQVSVRDLKTHLSTWLARAQAGEVVEVTSHRKPIARITAVKSPEQGSADPLQAAIEAGVVSWNGQKPVFPPPIKLERPGKTHQRDRDRGSGLNG